MFTVSILINGNPILTRSCVNQLEINSEGETVYKVDDGSIVYHKMEDGAVKLASKLLSTIVEPKGANRSKLNMNQQFAASHKAAEALSKSLTETK